MIEEIKNSIKAKLYDSTYTPFMSSYIVSWIFLNHKYLLIYFGDFKNKLSLLRMYEITLSDMLIPLIVALIYVYIYPYFFKKFYSYTLNKQKEQLIIKQEVENKKLLSVEQSREMRLEQYKFEDIIDKKDKKIDYYKNELKSIEEEQSLTKEHIKEEFKIKENAIVKKTKKESENEIKKLKENGDKLLSDYHIIEIDHDKLSKENQVKYEHIKKLEKEITSLNNELNIKNNNTKNMKNEKFLKEFTNDELNILETIYNNSITNEQYTERYINKINEFNPIPKIKIELILKSLQEKGYVKLENKNYINDLTKLGKTKAHEIFG